MEKPILNVSQLEAFVNTPANITAMKALFQAIAYAETLRPVIEGKQREIINFYKFQVSEECGKYTDKETITEPKHMYLASEEDMNLYCKEMKAFYFSPECPVKPSKPDNCPLLEAESLVRAVKREIVELFAPSFGFDAEKLFYSLKNYNEFFELMLTMFAPKVQETI